MANHDVKHLYLVYYGFKKTVIPSQVLTPVRRLREQGLDVELVFFDDFGRWITSLFSAWGREKRTFLKGLPSVSWPRVPRNLLAINTIVLFVTWLPWLLTKKRIVVHARGFQGADIVLPLKSIFGKIRLICDARGIPSAEYDYVIRHSKKRNLGLTESWWKKQLDVIQARAVKQADVVFSVSKAMIDYLKETSGSPQQQNWEYIPCATDVKTFSSSLEKRDQRRKELGLENRLVVLFVGGLGIWQNINDVVTIFKLIKNADSSAFFLGITPKPDQFNRVLHESNIKKDDFKVVSASFSEMPSYLVCGDFGILLRKEDVVNQCACPTKFAEYVACGLHVLTTEAVWDVAALTKESQCGTIIRDIKNINFVKEDVQKALKASRSLSERIQRSTKLAKSNFDWAIHLPKMKKWYDTLAQLNQ